MSHLPHHACHYLTSDSQNMISQTSILKLQCNNWNALKHACLTTLLVVQVDHIALKTKYYNTYNSSRDFWEWMLRTSWRLAGKVPTLLLCCCHLYEWKKHSLLTLCIGKNILNVTYRENVNLHVSKWACIPRLLNIKCIEFTQATIFMISLYMRKQYKEKLLGIID